MGAVRVATLAMGTRFELVITGDDEPRLRAIGEAAVERIEEAHRAFTRFDNDSLLAHLRRTAPKLTAVDADQFALFTDAVAVTRLSAGGFDPSLGRRSLDTALILEPATRRVGLSGPDTALDFGAIAKGHAVDLAVATLKEAGVTAAFVHGGTSSGFGLGTPPGQTGWRVSLGRMPGDPILDLRDQGFSVAGALSIRAGSRRGHTINPRTGRALRADRRVAVVGPSARLADAWSTAVLVTGRRPQSLPDHWRIWQCDAHHRWIEMARTAG